MEEGASGRLLQEESKKEGAVAFHVYQAYWRAIGAGLALAILFSLLLMQGRNKPQRPLSHPQPCLLGPHHILYLVPTLTKRRDSPGMVTAGTIGLPPLLRASQRPDRCTP